MSIGILLATAAAGGIGAALRYVVDQLLTSARHRGFPVGILVVNITGSLALGVLTGLGSLLASDLAVIFGVGLLGGYTTFSTVHVETVLLAQRGRWRQALLNLFGSLFLTVLAAALGVTLGIGFADIITTN